MSGGWSVDGGSGSSIVRTNMVGTGGGMMTIVGQGMWGGDSGMGQGGIGWVGAE